MSLEPYLRDKLRMYPNQELCKRHVIAALAVYKDLRPSTEKFVDNNGRPMDLFTLEGTIPVNFRGTIYNIPICIFLQETHPFIPPMVFVRPTTGMAIKVSKFVDNAGRVFMPYLSEWSHPRSDLISLIQILCCIFAEEPPVFSRPVGHNPPPQPRPDELSEFKVNKSYKSEDEPPNVPYFTGVKTKKAKTSATTSEVGAENKVKMRGSILQQLKDLKTLKDEDILSHEEYNQQKEKLVKELIEL